MGNAANDLEDDHRRGAKSRGSPRSTASTSTRASTVQAGDRDGLERLCRYGARPPFSLERLSILPDGRVAYRLRKSRKNGATHLVMTPVQLLAKLAALIPPPRFPLTRFAGVLAPNSTWRASVVPDATHSHATTRPKKKAAKKSEAAAANPSPLLAEAETTEARTSLGAEPQPPAQRSSRRGEHATEDAQEPASGPRNRTGIAPEVYARIDWASLLKRTYIICDVNERATIVEILSHLGLPFDAPKLARARDPTFDAA